MEQKKHILLYDGECPMCTFQMRVISWLDWLNKVEMVPLQDERSATIAQGVTRADLQSEIHCVTPDGSMYRGARAIRFLGFRIPLLFPVGLFLWIPGVIFFAQKFYKFVADRRLFFSRIFGCKGACAILPEKEAPTAGDR